MSGQSEELKDAIASTKEEANKLQAARVRSTGMVSGGDLKAKVAAALQKKAAATAATVNSAQSSSPPTPKQHEQKPRESKPSNLPCPSKEIVDGLISGHSSQEISQVISYLTRAIRGVKSTDTMFKVGDTVRCISGRTKDIGIVGTVTQVKNTRLWVSIPGRASVFYPMMSEVEIVREEAHETPVAAQSVDEVHVDDEEDIEEDVSEETGT